jgi:hypothetical protein
MFLAEDGSKRTAWHMAAENGQLEVLQTFWEWAKQVLTQDELNIMFLAEDQYAKTAWHMAASYG